MSDFLSFCCVGPQRTSSSWFDRILRSYSQFTLPGSVKETFFFDKCYSGDLNPYYKYFTSDKNTSSLRGEIAPTYFDSSRARHALSKLFPNLKIFIFVRDPVERCYSLFHHEYSKGRCPRDFFDAIKVNPDILHKGIYRIQVPIWRQYFPGQVYLWPMSKVHNQPDFYLHQFFKLFDLDYQPAQNQSIYDPFGKALRPTVPFVSYLSASVATSLRSYGLNRFVSLGRDMGLKKLLFRTSKIQPDRHITDYLTSYFAPEYQFLESEKLL